MLRELKYTEDILQKKELEDKLLDFLIKVIYLRARIIFYGKSGKRCEMLVKELLENERQ